MDAHSLDRLAGRVAAGAALAFLVVLFLPWHEVAVRVPGAVELEATSSGWSGWGFIAGLVAIALAALALVRPGTLATAAAGTGLAVAAALAVFTGEATVQTQAVGVEAGSTLWAAWLGLALALVAAAAALAPAALRSGRETPTTAGGAAAGP